MVRMVNVLLLLTISAVSTVAQSSVQSICNLQEAGRGSHITVQISGVYGPGLDRSVLSDAACPNVYTWVELDLHSQKNKEKLRKLLDDSRQANVVVKGEFYGPPLPDLKLPEAIKKQYHPGWGHLGAFPTKIVIYEIDSVEAVGNPAG